MRVKRTKKNVTEKHLQDLIFKDFLEGLTDPDERQILESRGLLQWTDWHANGRKGNIVD